MKLWKDRRPGAIFGMSLMLLVPVGFGVWAVTVNPWFVDEPFLFAGMVLLPCAVIGGYVGALISRAWFSRSLFTVNLVGIAWIFFHPTPDKIDGVKLLVFGMDGATWDLVDKLHMPTLEALQVTGDRAVLESETPMLSPLLWTTIATGHRPDQHGIRGFVTSADKIERPRVWDIADEEGLSVGLYKWLVTYPPQVGETSGGFVVPAWLALGTETAPEELSIIKQIEMSNRLERQNKAEPIPAWKSALLAIPQGLRFSTLRTAGTLWASEKIRRPGPMEKARQMQLLRVSMDRDFFLAQLHRNPTTVATFSDYATDALGHTHWQWMTDCHDMTTLAPIEDSEDCPDWAGAVPDAYRQADAVLGEVLDTIGWETHVVVVSDHGFRAANEDDASRYFVPLTSHLQEQLKKVVGENGFPIFKGVQVQRLGKKLVVSLSGNNVGLDGETDLDTQRKALGEYLDLLLQESTGEPLFAWEDMPNSSSTIGLSFRVERLDTARLGWDSVLDTTCWNNPTVGGSLEDCTVSLNKYAEPDEPHQGEHDSNGILLASGPDVIHQVRTEPVQLIDVAPSLLTLLGLPTSDDMEGEVLWGKRLLPRPANYYQHLAPVEVMDTIEINKAMGGNLEDALEALGYIE